MTKMTDAAATAAIGAASRELRLPVVRNDAARLAEIAQRSQLTYLAFLAEVLSAEVDERAENRRRRRVAEARFPRIKRALRVQAWGGAVQVTRRWVSTSRAPWPPILAVADTQGSKGHGT